MSNFQRACLGYFLITLPLQVVLVLGLYVVGLLPMLLCVAAVVLTIACIHLGAELTLPK